MSRFQTLFEGFRDELDDHHDRRERLIKASRDITNLSKKIIFALHRLLTDGAISLWGPVSESGLNSIKKAEKQFDIVKDIFLGMEGDLADGMYWRYCKPVSGGLQEYIEALAFSYYLQHHSLIPFEAVRDTLRGLDGSLILPLTTEDYLLGVSDLTGEIMRLAITSIGTQNTTLADVLQVCSLVREWYGDLERLTPFVRELRKKQEVTEQSLHKIEDAAYGLSVRGAEYSSLRGFMSYPVASFDDGDGRQDD